MSTATERFGRILAKTETACGTLDNFRSLCDDQRLEGILPADFRDVLASTSDLDEAIHEVVGPILKDPVAVKVFTAVLAEFKQELDKRMGVDEAEILSKREQMFLDMLPWPGLQHYYDRRAVRELKGHGNAQRVISVRS